MTILSAWASIGDELGTDDVDVDAAGDVLAARAADADPVIDVCDATCACLPASSILSELPLARASRGDVRRAHVRKG